MKSRTTFDVIPYFTPTPASSASVPAYAVVVVSIADAPIPVIVSPESALPAVEDTDQGPVGSKFFLNGGSLQNGGSLSGALFVTVGGVEAVFQHASDSALLVTVPNSLPPGKYEVDVFAAVKDIATKGNFDNVLPTKGGSGINFDASSRGLTSLVGSRFLYGAQFDVVPNAVPVVDSVVLNDSGGTGEFFRGVGLELGFTLKVFSSPKLKVDLKPETTIAAKMTVHRTPAMITPTKAPKNVEKKVFIS